jgi:hypothetical protein
MSFWDRLDLYAAKGPAALDAPFALLPADRFHQIVGPIVGGELGAESFVEVRRGRWARRRLPWAIDLVELQARKGASHGVTWGLSLDFVPNVSSSGKVSWHRSPKAAVLDLEYNPMDYERDTRPWGLSRFATAEELVGDATGLAVRARAASRAFFLPLTRVEAVLAAFEEKERRPSLRLAARNYPRHFLASAFAAARSGNRPEAARRLAEHLERQHLSSTAAEVLRELLDRPVEPVAG